MPELTTQTVTSLGEYTALIESVRADGNPTPWYRGCTPGDRRLQPQIFSHPDSHETEGLKQIESQILSRFRQRCVPYLDRTLERPWEHVFLAQHFGVPTRLLDWTENPFIALYFAVAWRPHGGPPPEGAAAIWILDPAAWNQCVLAQSSYKGGPLSIDDDVFSGYDPAPSGPTRRDPVAIYGTHNSARIVAQRGVFTIFGHNADPMEDVFQSNDSFVPRGLIKVHLPAGNRADLREGLFSIGITHSVVWPDLDGLARDIKRELGFDD